MTVCFSTSTLGTVMMVIPLSYTAVISFILISLAKLMVLTQVPCFISSSNTSASSPVSISSINLGNTTLMLIS